jgi:hypothetical protein
MDGTPSGLQRSFTVPADGQIAAFVHELFPELPSSFQGVAKVTAPDLPISVAALRGTYNERGDFLVTTTPPLNESAPATELVFPHIVSGSGYSTQIIVLGEGSGQLYLLSPDGTVRPGSSIAEQRLAPMATFSH